MKERKSHRTNRIPARKDILISLLLILFCSHVAYAVDVGINGFFQLNYSYSLHGRNPDGGDFKWAEERGQIKLELLSDKLRLFSKTDLYYDHIDKEADTEFRELYIDYTETDWDLRIGRQIITWGLGDLVFINDVFPKDYEAFFSGRPLEYMKKPVDALKVNLYPEVATINVVIIPFFEPDRFPGRKRFYLYDPMAKFDKETIKPTTTLDNTEIALRVYKNISGIEASLYLYRGYYRAPSVYQSNPPGVKLYHPPLTVYGFSLQGAILRGVMSIEAGYYDSRSDRDGTDPYVPNSSIKFLMGYQSQLWEDFTAEVQYFIDYMEDYSEYRRSLPAGMPKDKRYSHMLTLRLTQLLMHQTLRLSLFSFWGLSDGDYLVNPEIRYSLSDNLWMAVGGFVFGGGERWSQFGSLDRNDNLYTQLRYEF